MERGYSMLGEFGPVMTVEEVCEILMIGKNTVYSLIKTGQIEGFRTGRTWKIKRDGLVQFIRREAGLLPS